MRRRMVWAIIYIQIAKFALDMYIANRKRNTIAVLQSHRRSAAERDYHRRNEYEMWKKNHRLLWVFA